MKNIDKKKLYMIIGVMVLGISIVGSAYAYFSASASATISGTAGGGELTLNVEELSTSATGDLIPLDNTTEMLTKAALGYGNTSSTYDNTKSCIDKNGKTACQIYKITITNNSSIPVILNGGVSLTGDNTPNIECAVMASSISVTDNKSCKGKKTLASKYSLSANSTKEYYVMVYIKNIKGVQTDSGDFNGTITFTSTDGKQLKARFKEETAAEYITRLYTEADKSTVTNNSITYNYAPSESLMNDRLGGTTTSLDGGNIRYYGVTDIQKIKMWQSGETQYAAQELLGREFTSEQDCINEIPTMFDILYDCSTKYEEFGFSSQSECEEALESSFEEQGGKEALIQETQNSACSETTAVSEGPNNYIYFNCSDYSNQSSDTCEKWRIIGVFDGKLKIIRNSRIGSYSWDTSASSVNYGWGINEWSQADLMKLLNPGYTSESVGGSLYYNSGSGTCYNDEKNGTTSCNFTTTGIKNDATRNKVATVTWNTGGWDTSQVYSNVMYEKERGTTVYTGTSDGITRQTTWSGKIALPYPSDYGYATDFSQCSKNLNQYDSSDNSYACRTNDWMYPIITNNGVNFGWLLAPDSGIAYGVWLVNSAGAVSNSNYAFYAYGVAPVLYLGSDEVLESGHDGSNSDPYRLG